MSSLLDALTVKSQLHVDEHDQRKKRLGRPLSLDPNNTISAKIGHEKKYSNGIDFLVIKTLYVTKNCNLTDNQIKRQKKNIVCTYQIMQYNQFGTHYQAF